jgi:predicted component of type VI protein secretion system
MKRNQTRTGRAVSAFLLLTVAGCVNTSPVDRHFGEAINMIKAQQTLNPTAALNANPVTGIDGQAAKSAYDQYQKTFKTP